MGFARIAVGAGLAAMVTARLLRAARGPEWDPAGRVAIVTGASRGLGLLIARELADRGCRLVLCARDTAELEGAAAELRERGAEVSAIGCDVGDRDQVDALITQARDQHGRIDLVVNNAGIIQVGPWEAMSIEDHRRALDIMFWGPLYLVRAALPELRRQRGRVLNITSIGGKVSVPRLLPYCCAKFAAVALSEGLYAGLAHQGIGVTTVVPGLMRTGSHLRAEFTGAGSKDYAWFALAASLPPFSMDAERAAHRIVRGLVEGRSHLTLTPLAQLAMRVHGAAPEVTVRALRGLDALLPRETHTEAMRGERAEAEVRAPLLRRLLTLGARAGRRFRQVPESGEAGGRD